MYGTRLDLNKSPARIVIFSGLAAALGVAGYWLQFTTFMIYDDEGYVLLSLKHFTEHGGLYDRVYTQYGPFPYLLYDGLQRAFGFDFNNVMARWLSLSHWLGISAICGALVTRSTRSTVWGAYTMAGTFAYLWVMINEPAHPGGLLALLVAMGAFLGTELWNRNRPNGFFILTAAIGAALVLTKINVGVFFLGSAFTWLAIHSAPARVSRALTWTIAIGCAALPFVLMRDLFDQVWVRLFALVFTGAVLGLLLVVRSHGQAEVRLKTWLLFSGTLLAVLFVLVVLTLARGTSPASLLNGVLLEPLRHPGVYFFAMNWRIGTGILALVSLGVVAWTVHTKRLDNPAFIQVVAVSRALTALVFFCTALKIIPTSQAAWGMCYGVSLAWLFVVPLQPDVRGFNTRAWVALILVFQFLHAYPVAGSQLNWGTFLWVSLLALGLHDAAPILAARFAPAARWPGRIAAAVVVSVTLFSTVQLFAIGWNRYFTSQPLRLPGAEIIRLPHEITYTLRIVDENLREHGDLLFSLPGQFSANLRTGLATPTLQNATHWFSLLRQEQQQAIIDRLASRPRALMLVQRESLDYLNRYEFKDEGPLHTWLMGNFEKAIDVGGYEVWAHRGRTLAPLSTARVSDRSGSFNDPLLTLCLSGTGRAITRIELCSVSQPRVPLVVFNATNTLASLRPCAQDGSSGSSAVATSWPIAFIGLNYLELQLPPLHLDGGWSNALLVLRDAHDQIVSEVRIVN